jgi:hypothetical protein
MHCYVCIYKCQDIPIFKIGDNLDTETASEISEALKSPYYLVGFPEETEEFFSSFSPTETGIFKIAEYAFMILHDDGEITIMNLDSGSTGNSRGRSAGIKSLLRAFEQVKKLAESRRLSQLYCIIADDERASCRRRVYGRAGFAPCESRWVLDL